MSRVKKYNSTTSEWEYADGPAGDNFVKSTTTGNLTVSDTQPSSPLESDVWIEPGGKIGTSDIYDGAVTAGKIDFATFPAISTVDSWKKVKIGKLTKYFAKFTESQTFVSGETKVLTSRALPDSLRLVDCDSIQVTYALSGNAADFNIQIEREFHTSVATSIGGYIRNNAGASRTITITSSMEITVISA